MKLNLYKYELPFKNPYRWADRTITHRKGIIIEAKDHNLSSLPCIGEVAPLPGHSPESLAEVQSILIDNMSDFESIFNQSSNYKEWNTSLEPWSLPPSVRFGLDTAFTMYMVHKHRTPMHELLFSTPNPRIPLNGTMGLTTQEDALIHAQRLIHAGYGTLKCKVGDSFDREFAILKEIREKFPDVKLRIDVNGRWSQNTAIEYLEKLKPLHIQYCEQPIASGDPDSLNEVAQNASIPLAADESLADIDSIYKLADSKAFPFFIIKPMRFGSFNDIISACRYARESGINIIFSSLLEAFIGRWATAALAAGAASVDYAQGLATHDLFKTDLTGGYELIHGGYFQLPEDYKTHQSVCTSIQIDHLVPFT